MPVHWFYRTSDILKYFPPYGIERMEPAPDDHPSSIMSLHSTESGGRRSARKSVKHHGSFPNRQNEALSGEVVGDIILKGRRELWGGNRTHYHHNMLAGDNTLNAYCARLMIRHLNENCGYDSSVWLKQYVEFMMSDPPQHPDTYAESYHRGFFSNLKKGMPITRCGAVTHDTASMGALVTIAPLAFALFKEHTLEQAQDICSAHVELTHPDDFLQCVVRSYVELLYTLLKICPRSEDNPNQNFVTAIERATDVIPGTKLTELLQRDRSDASVVGGLYSTACYITDSWPSVCYLAAKYNQDVNKALLINTNLGGENAHRGSVLGSIVGLMTTQGGDMLYEQLLHKESISAEIQQFVQTFSH